MKKLVISESYFEELLFCMFICGKDSFRSGNWEKDRDTLFDKHIQEKAHMEQHIDNLNTIEHREYRQFTKFR